MRSLIVLFIVCFYFQSGLAQHSIKLDVDGTKLTNAEFRKKWTNEQLNLYAWQYKGEDGNNYIELRKGLFETSVQDFDSIRSLFKKIYNVKIPKKHVILLEYRFKDDMCTTESRDNKWTKSELDYKVAFANGTRSELKSEGVTYITLFENDIILESHSNKKGEYFFNDIDNFFRNNLFKTPSLCGSYALIKPNGETLVRNGEYNAEFMAEHLKSEIWNRFFNKEGN
ncbi:hypothetical protein [Hanstruepera marina]|uniref:hypothetical protein n=1 Tax=Hanstruepera marina TaxID=2873265 RepID=UPI001CA77450|nr:hypothetical protein [Hanstruepera marina]